MYHVTTDNAFPYRVCGGQQDSGSACVDSRSHGRRDHVPRLASGEHPGVRRGRARSEESGSRVRQHAHRCLALQSPDLARPTIVGPDMTGFNRNVRTMPIEWSPVDSKSLFYASNAVFKTVGPRPQLDAHQPRSRAPDLGRCPANAGKYASTVTPEPSGTITALAPVADPRRCALGRHGRRQHPGHDGRRREVDECHAAGDQAVDAHLQHRRRPLRRADGVRRREHASASTTCNPHFLRTHDGGKTWTEIDNGIAPGAVANSIREDPRKQGAAVRRHRHAGVGLVRRRRSLGIAATQHAGDLGARHRR